MRLIKISNSMKWKIDYGAPSHLIEGLEETLNLSENGGSDFVTDSTFVEQDHEKSQPR